MRKIKGFIESILTLFIFLGALSLSLLICKNIFNKYYTFRIRTKFLYDLKHMEKIQIANKNSIDYILNKKIVNKDINWRDKIHSLPKIIIINRQAQIHINIHNIKYFYYNKQIYQESIDSFINSLNNIKYIENYNKKYVNVLLLPNNKK